MNIEAMEVDGDQASTSMELRNSDDDGDIEWRFSQVKGNIDSEESITSDGLFFLFFVQFNLSSFASCCYFHFFISFLQEFLLNAELKMIEIWLALKRRKLSVF